MDPITTILAALTVAGARVGGEAIQDAYVAFKGLLVRRFGQKDPKLEGRIDEYVADQEVYFRPAQKALRDVGAESDQEVIDKALELLSMARQAQPDATAALVGRVNARNVVVTQQNFGPINQTSGGTGQP